MAELEQFVVKSGTRQSGMVHMEWDKRCLH